MEEPLYKCYCKATSREDGEPRYSHNWVAAKRAMFKVFQDKLMCGSWEIPFEDIEQATVYRARSLGMRIEILHVVTKDQKNYQFGFNPWAKPIQHIKLPLEQKQLKMKYSPFSLVLRLVLIAWLLYYAGTTFKLY